MTEDEKKLENEISENQAVESEVLNNEVKLPEEELLDLPPVVIDEGVFNEVVEEDKKMLSETNPEKKEEPKNAKQLRAEQKQAKLDEKQAKAEEKQQKKVEKKEARVIARKERAQEIRSLIRVSEAAVLITLIILGIDQVGLQGFLNVWLFIALIVASVAVLLLGILRSVRHKRSGIIFFVAVLGIVICAAWFIYLLLSQGLRVDLVPR